MKIWKYDLNVDDYTVLEMPKGAETLSVQDQRGTPRLWALVDPSAITEKRTFKMAGTGHDIDGRNLRFIDTFQLMNGGLVFHVFEVLG